MKRVLVLFFFFLSFNLFAGPALVIIDMQPYFATRGGVSETPENKKSIQDILSYQVEAIKVAKKANIPIIVIEYDLHAWAKEGNKTSDVLTSAIGNYKKTTTLLKNTDGMFDSGNANLKKLLSYVKENSIDKLIITGANGGACVLSSIEGAIKKDINVVAYTKGIADFNYSKFIFPYKYNDNGVTLSYASEEGKKCKFKQTDDLAVISLEVTKGDLENSDLVIESSSRSKMKEDSKATETRLPASGKLNGLEK